MKNKLKSHRQSFPFFWVNCSLNGDLIYKTIKTSPWQQIRPHTVTLEVVHIVFLKWCSEALIWEECHL